MLRQKLQRSYSIRDPAQQKFSCIVRLMTTRSVCLSVLVTLCLTSLLFTVSNFASESYSSHYTIGPRRFVHEAKKSHGPAVGNTVAAKSRVGAQDADEQMPRAVLNRKIDAVFKQLGAQGNGSVGALRAPVEKLFKNVEERRMQQNDIGTDLRNSTEDDVDESYDPMVMREESQEEEFVDPKRVSFLKSALRYTSTFKSRYHHYYNEDIKLLPPQTKGVVILTNYRSGSTFLGQLFNQHTDAFYTFEPLLPFTGVCDRELPKMTQVLHRMLKCDFPDMIKLYSQMRGPMRQNHLDVECLIDNFCFRHKTDDLCGQKLCPFGIQKKCAKCGPIHLPRVNNQCRTKKMSVIKVIRLCDIAGLKTIVDDPTMDLKVIHLVRDPRGIQSSRLKIDKSWNVKGNSKDTCLKLGKNAKQGFGNTSATKWLQGRYMRIRYEDLALEPYKYAAKIYRFVGLEFQSKIKRWIAQNTRGDEGAPKRKNQAFTTSRDSAAAMESWRKHLSFENVTAIQGNCARMMDMFGYTPVASKAELLDFNKRLIT